MRYQKIRRLARTRLGDRLDIHTPGRSALLDYKMDRLGITHHGGRVMWQGLEVGTVIVQETFSFPFVGRVVEWDDTRIVLADAVRVLWDGRHGEFAAGRPPANAEIEKTHSPLAIPADWCGPWAPYAGGMIPRPQ